MTQQGPEYLVKTDAGFQPATFPNANEARREMPVIERQSARLSASVDAVEQSLDNLVRKIETVLGPMDPEMQGVLTDKSPAGVEQSSMAHYIEGVGDRCMALSRVMDDITRRCQL